MRLLQMTQRGFDLMQKPAMLGSAITTIVVVAGAVVVVINNLFIINLIII
jgi:hypothetical protein